MVKISQVTLVLTCQLERWDTYSHPRLLALHLIHCTSSIYATAHPAGLL